MTAGDEIDMYVYNWTNMYMPYPTKLSHVNRKWKSVVKIWNILLWHCV